MILSNALPIQFWLADCETFNEEEVDGILRKCWSQPWECDDEIRLQFQGDSDKGYILRLYDEEDTELREFDFENVSDDVFELAFTPSDDSPDLCDKQVVFKIFESFEDIVENGSFDYGTEWSNTGSGTNWSIVDGAAKTILTGGSQTAKRFHQTLTQSYSGEFVIRISFNVSASANTIFGEVRLGSEIIAFQVEGLGTRTIELDVSAIPSFNTISFSFSSSGGATKTISVYRLQVFDVNSGSEVLVAKSDPVTFKDSWEETILIEYTNTRNYAGLVYEDQSPDQTFQIRVPARFYHKRYPKQQNALNLTSTVVVTSTEMKTQKLLEVIHAPYYFHEKIQLILQHSVGGTVTIGDSTWKMEEGYDINEGNKRWPLKSATTYLTKSDSVVRNVM